ncbi:MAG: O-methyltransferase involved in polyketide biosynthesis [Bacteroidia bacterium]|jgi:O-methyltransferase involved in polyketide biosynthesis
MGMNGSYYKAHVENMKLRKNKDRYKRLKDNVYDRIEQKISLSYTEPSEAELKQIRNHIFDDIRQEQTRRKKLMLVALACGLVTAICVIYFFQSRVF